jgi:hypothetical protein
MALRAQIAFDQSLTSPVNYFTLDDPVRGVLDNTTYPLGGDVLVDVTAFLRAVSIRRGRSRELDRFTAGNATLTLDNRARTFDPLYSAGPYFGSILPRKQVVVDIGGVPLFTGSVADWNLSYDVGGQSLAEPSCTDALDLLNGQQVVAGTATSQLSGARVSAILDEVSWPTSRRDIGPGQATLDADAHDQMSALAYLQQVEASESGALFIGRAGDVVFRDRAFLQDASSVATFGGTGIPFVGMQVSTGTEELINDVSVTWSSGTVVGGTATATNAASVADYGTFAASYATLLSSEAQAANMANWIAGRYSTPAYRVDAVTVTMRGLTATQQAEVLAVELADVVLVTWTPNGIGPAISQYVTVDGIEHSADFTLAHEVTLTLSETFAAFILDSASFGVLDSDYLGY